jgi:hypothetical protein
MKSDLQYVYGDFLYRVQWGKALDVGSGLQDGEFGSSSCEESPHCWSDGLATFFPDSLKVDTPRELRKLSPSKE